MGLASSQARLLNLTTRMHQIEYKAAKLEAEKLQMANESTRVYEDYLEALESTKVQYKILTTDGSVSYNDIHSYQEFIDAGYAINFNGTVYDGSTAFTVTADALNAIAPPSSNATLFLNTEPVILVLPAKLVTYIAPP